MNGVPLLDPALCRARQRRLLDRMTGRGLDAVVVVAPEHVQYLTGHRWDFRFAPLAALLASGRMLLACPDKPVETAAADDVRTYEAKWKSTLRLKSPIRATVCSDGQKPKLRSQPPPR